MAEGYYHTKESVDQYIGITKNMNGLMLILELEKHLPKGASLMELGTGPGNDFDILNKKYKITGSDLSEEFLSRLRIRFPNAPFLKLNAANFSTDEKFDAIYSNKVLHHLTDDELKQSIISQHKAVNPKGIICHSFWKGKGSETYAGMFVNNHNDETLNHFFQPLFDIIEIIPYQEFEIDDSLIVIAKKK